jgi:hypothetical protein
MTEEEYARDELESADGRKAKLQEVYEAGIEDAFEDLPVEDIGLG